MKKQLNLTFCENLIFSDFFLIQAPKKSLKLNRSVSLKRQNYFLLNIFKLQKELKQFLRMLQLLCLSLQTRKNMPRFLFFNSIDFDHSELIVQFFDSYIEEAAIENVSERDLTEKLMFNTSSKQILISFMDLTNSRNPIDFFYHKLFLVNTMNIRSKNSIKQSSFYGINNIIDTNRKIFLILSLIEGAVQSALPPFKRTDFKDNY
jgi:hypothetical protein